MNEYIIYTTEGRTIAPNEHVEVENCQVLGCTRGNNSEEATDNLLKNNPWIAEAGFDRSEFIVKQIVSNEKIQTMEFQIEILESNSRVETVYAKTKEDAIAMVRNQYENGEIVFTDDNSYVNVSFRTL